MLKKRVLTATLMAILFLLALFCLPAMVFHLLVTLLLIVSLWEWSKLCGYQSYAFRGIYLALVTAFALILSYFTKVLFFESTVFISAHGGLFYVMCAATIWWILAVAFIKTYPKSSPLIHPQWVGALIGFFVLVPSWLSIMYLRSVSQGGWLLLLLICLVVVADISAYFSGRYFGVTPLASKVSPGKTREGVLGAMCVSSLLGLMVAAMFAKEHWLSLWLVFLLTALASVIGDLLESVFKRERGLKDSGDLLPGHGGILDRIDSLTAAAPIFTLGLLATGWHL